MPQQPPPPPALIPVTTVMGYGGHYVPDNGCSPPTMRTIKCSPNSSYSASPSPPSVSLQQHHHHQQQHHHHHHSHHQQLVEQMHQAPSTTLHHYSYSGAAAVDMFNNACTPVPVPATHLPTYEQAVNSGQQQHPHHHVHWYPSGMSAHHQVSSSATATTVPATDGLQ